MDQDERMRIEWHCERLTKDHVHHLDHDEFDALVELFTPEGVFDRAGRVHHGQDEIRNGMAQRRAITTRHVLTNLRFTEVTPDEASSVAYVVTYHSEERSSDGPVTYAPSAPRILEFHTTYCRTDDGWRLAAVIAKAIFTSGG